VRPNRHLVPALSRPVHQPRHWVALAFWIGSSPVWAVDPPLKVQGSSTVNPVCAEASEILGKQEGMAITVDPQGGSSGGLAALGHGLVDVAMSSKPVSDRERKRYPEVSFHETVIGTDAVALVVSSPIHAGGLESLSRDEIRGIFEGRITSWSEVGGPHLAVFVYDKEPGRGTREVFEAFVYGKEEPPFVTFKNYAQVGGNEETRTKVAAHGSAISQLSATWAKGDSGLAVVGIRSEEGRVIWPDEASIRSGENPMARKVFLVTNGPPIGNARTFIDFILSSAGQELVERHGYLPLSR